MLNLIICGQKSFGAAVFDALRATDFCRVVAVSCPIDETDALFRKARTHEAPLIPQHQLTAKNLPENLHLGVSAHCHSFISRKTRLRALHGFIGYHPSILPLHRGRDAVKWTVKMHDKISGGSVYWLDDRVDGGDILAQRHCLVQPNWSASELWAEALFPIGVALLTESVAKIAAGQATRFPQPESLATWEPSMNPPPLGRPDLLMLPPAK